MRVKFLAQGKQRGPLMGLELTNDRYPPITSQTRYPLRHAASTLDLKYTVLYFSIMWKTQLDIETNIMGEKFVLYMHTYDNHTQITATVPCCLSRGTLSGRSPRLFACCLPRLSAQNKLCPRWQKGKRKIRAVWTVPHKTN